MTADFVSSPFSAGAVGLGGGANAYVYAFFIGAGRRARWAFAARALGSRTILALQHCATVVPRDAPVRRHRFARDVRPFTGGVRAAKLPLHTG